ncbi:DoxX family protein [Parasphingorhabdus pacifica]
MLIRRLARPLLAASFIYGGVQVLRDVPSHAKAAAPLVNRTTECVRDWLPEQVPTDAETLVKLDGVVKVGAGTMLALGRFPRLCSLLLADSLVATTLATHAFWEIDDPQERAAQRIHFLKNASVLGGLLISGVDTKGKPSVGYRTKHNAHKIAKETKKAAHKK